MKPDKIDCHILHHLQNDGRMTNVELADRVGISAPPCLRRVRVLEENGIIKGYHADVDPESLDFGVTAFVFISLKNRTDSDLQQFEKQINTLSVVRECYLLAGGIDFLLKIVVKTSKEYKLFIDELGHNSMIENITSTLSIRRSKWLSGVPIDETMYSNKEKETSRI